MANAGPIANNIIAPWAYGIYGMFNPEAQYANKGAYPYNDYQVPSGPKLQLPGFLTGNTGGAPGYGGGAPGSIMAGKPELPGYGQSNVAGPGYGMQDLTTMWMNGSLNGQFQAPQSIEELVGRRVAQQRWGNASGDFANYFGNTGPGGSNPMARAWQNQTMGAFDPNGQFVGGNNSSLFGTAAQLVNLQNLNPYNDPNRWAGALNPYNSQYVNQTNAAKNPLEMLMLAKSTQNAGFDPNKFGQQGVDDTKALSNSYESSLMSAIDAETKRTLASQTPEVAAQMAAAGYGESGSGQGAMGQLQAQIMEQANRDKIRALADMRQQGMNQQAQAINQRTMIGADNANNVFNANANFYGNQAQAYNQALANTYNQSAGLLGAGLGANADRQQANAQLLNSALFGSEDAQQRRATNQLAMNQAGLGMGMNLFNAGESLFNNRMDRSLGFGTRDQDFRQQSLTEIANTLLMPFKTGLQMTTGINTSPVGGGYKVSPWAQMGANVGSSVLSGIVGGGDNRGYGGDWPGGWAD